MKKKLALVLLSTMLVMTACGNDANTNGIGTTEESTVETSAETTEPETESVEESTEEQSTEDQSQDETTYAPGVFTKEGYESEFLGYRFTKPENFILMTQEDILALMGVSMDLLSDDFSEQSLAYAEAAVIYDLVASSTTTGSSLSVSLQPNVIAGMSLDVFVDEMAKQLSTLTALNYTISEEYEEVTIAGADYLKLATVASNAGVELYQDYYLGVIGDYIVNIVVSYVDKADSDAILSAMSEF